jgi:hypothetical protein
MNKEIKGWVHVAITVATLLISLGVVYATVVGDVKANTEHRLDSNVHMPLKEKEDHFVTRREFEQFKQNQEEMLKILREMKN